MKVAVIIQARMSSTRLPGKVLSTIGAQPMLALVVERSRRSKTVSDVAVATTRDSSDDPIVEYCQERGYPCYRGSLLDVLDRYYQAAKWLDADLIVRLTADCPLIDPTVIDATVNAFLGHVPPGSQQSISNVPSYHSPDFPFDFAANRLPPPWRRTYPIGLDTEVCSFSALERAWYEAIQPHQREHVMPYLYDDVGLHFDQPSRFRVLLIHHHPDYGSLRWTVDTPQDLALLRRIYAHFSDRDDFSWQEVLALFQQQPELAELNASVPHKTLGE